MISTMTKPSRSDFFLHLYGQCSGICGGNKMIDYIIKAFVDVVDPANLWINGNRK